MADKRKQKRKSAEATELSGKELTDAAAGATDSMMAEMMAMNMQFLAKAPKTKTGE